MDGSIVTERSGSWLKYVRPAVRVLEPYKWEISSSEVSERYSIPIDDVLRFDTNTSPYQPMNLAAALRAFAEDMPLNEYPDTSYRELVDQLVAYTGFPAEQIVVGCGADEILDLIAKVFLEKGSRVVVTRPSYAMYPVLISLNDATLVPVDDQAEYHRDTVAISRAARDATAIFLCNPNNPTANLIPLADIRALVQSVSCPVVIDEAYFEFSGVTAAGLIAEFPHVIVVRTLSKAFSLAGLRVGYALAAPEMADIINRVRPPNSISSVSIRLASAALRDLPIMRERVAAILAEKARFAAALAPYVEMVFPSATNFLLIRVAEPARAVESFLRAGIVVRDLSARTGLIRCLRPTVRLPSENDRFVSALACQ